MATETWVVSGPQIIEIEDVEALRVQLVGGRVDVVARDEPGARIEIHRVDGRPLEVGLENGELRVGYAFTLGGWEGFLEKFRNFRDKDQADVHIAIPRDVSAKLGTLSAEGLLAGVRVSSVTGSIVVDGTRGALVTHAVSGEVVVRNHAGDIRMDSVSGEITASGALQRATASTVSGAISLDATAAVASVSASTVSGDVTVRLPAGQGFRVEARSVSGRVVVDGREHKGSSPGQVKVDLANGADACHVSANSVSGHVTVLRAPVGAA